MGIHDCFFRYRSTRVSIFQSFPFCCSNESRETQYKDNTQSLRLFGLRNVHAEDVHRVDANRLGKNMKEINEKLEKLKIGSCTKSNRDDLKQEG